MGDKRVGDIIFTRGAIRAQVDIPAVPFDAPSDQRFNRKSKNGGRARTPLPEGVRSILHSTSPSVHQELCVLAAGKVILLFVGGFVFETGGASAFSDNAGGTRALSGGERLELVCPQPGTRGVMNCTAMARFQSGQRIGKGSTRECANSMRSPWLARGDRPRSHQRYHNRYLFRSDCGRARRCGPSSRVGDGINAFACGWNPEAKYHNETSAHELLDRHKIYSRSFGYYLETLEKLVTGAAGRHQVLLKIALANTATSTSMHPTRLSRGQPRASRLPTPRHKWPSASLSWTGSAVSPPITISRYRCISAALSSSVLTSSMRPGSSDVILARASSLCTLPIHGPARFSEWG